MEYSKYQKAIFETYNTTKSNICVSAAPGSGKTFTLCELLKQTPSYLRTILLAFNKSIVEDITRKVPNHIQVKTCHSLGCGIIYKHYPFAIKITEYKNFQIAKQHLNLKHVKFDKQGAYIFNLSSMVDDYKLYMLDDKESFKNHVETGGFLLLNDRDVEDGWELLNWVKDYNNRRDHQNFMIDFSDMLYLPVLEKMKFPQYDVVMIDELQDVSLCQKRLIDNIIKPVTGRFVAVGDENQSIYEFIGANRQSFDEFKNHKNTVTLPLSVSYRCPKSVIKEANKIFEGVEAYEGNIEGEVRKGDIDEVTDGDFVLCRNNFPLFELWMYFIVNKKKAVIYGKDLEKTLTTLVGKVSGFGDEEVEEELDKLLRKVSDELRAKGVVNTSHHPKFVMLEENITIVKLLLNRYKTIKNVETHLQDIFSNIISKGITMMSCHRSKGLENDRIFFYKSSLIPSKYAETPEQLRSESCLFYVTLTRAKKSLIFID